jgi:hypothetical protein
MNAFIISELKDHEDKVTYCRAPRASKSVQAEELFDAIIPQAPTVQ